MPLIVVLLLASHCMPPVDDAPPLSGTLRSLPVPAWLYTGPVPPLVPPAAGVGPEPAVATVLPGLSEFPQAIEPSNARPMHKEDGMLFISNFLRSSWVRHSRRSLGGSRTNAVGRVISSTALKTPYDLEWSDSMPTAASNRNIAMLCSGSRVSPKSRP